jgi:hypothetical protein
LRLILGGDVVKASCGESLDHPLAREIEVVEPGVASGVGLGSPGSGHPLGKRLVTVGGIWQIEERHRAVGLGHHPLDHGLAVLQRRKVVGDRERHDRVGGGGDGQI